MMLYTTLHSPVVLYHLKSYRKVQKYNNYFTICSWSTYYDFYGKIDGKKKENYGWIYYLKDKGSIVFSDFRSDIDIVARWSKAVDQWLFG